MVDAKGGRGGVATATPRESNLDEAMYTRTMCAVNAGLDTGRGQGLKNLATFNRMTASFLEFLDAANTKNEAETEHMGTLFALDLTTVEQTLSRLQGIKRVQQQEQEKNQQKKEDIEQQIEEVRKAIGVRKKELAEARQQRQNMEEYEVVRDQIVREPVRAVTQAAMAAVQREMEELDAEAGRLDRAWERRRKQAALLFMALEDLTKVQDDQDVEPASVAAAAAAAGGGGGAATPLSSAAPSPAKGGGGDKAATGERKGRRQQQQQDDVMEEGEAAEEGQVAEGEGDPMQEG